MLHVGAHAQLFFTIGLVEPVLALYVRDNTTETREKVVKAANSVFGRLALDIILCSNEDFVMSKRADKPNEVSDKSGSVVVELTREQAKELVEKIESFTKK